LYGPRAADLVRELWREAARKPKINLGAASQVALLAVVRGALPLTVSLWTRTRDYIAAKRKEQERQRAVEEGTRAVIEHRAPMRVHLGGLGRGISVSIGAPPSISAP
jgi:hypothetical protein